MRSAGSAPAAFGWLRALTATVPPRASTWSAARGSHDERPSLGGRRRRAGARHRRRLCAARAADSSSLGPAHRAGDGTHGRGLARSPGARSRRGPEQSDRGARARAGTGGRRCRRRLGLLRHRLARAVGTRGRVYATDIQPEMLALIQQEDRGSSRTDERRARARHVDRIASAGRRRRSRADGRRLPRAGGAPGVPALAQARPQAGRAAGADRVPQGEPMGADPRGTQDDASARRASSSRRRATGSTGSSTCCRGSTSWCSAPRCASCGHLRALSALTILSSVARSSDGSCRNRRCRRTPRRCSRVLDDFVRRQAAVRRQPVSSTARIRRVARAKMSADGCFSIQLASSRSAGLPSGRPRCRASEISIARSAGVMPPSAHAISTIGTSGRMVTVSGVKPRSFRSWSSAGSFKPVLATNSVFGVRGPLPPASSR